MAIVPTIYDWRLSCAPIDQIFRAGGEAGQGGITLGGFVSENPQPGGRGELVMNFAPFATEEANLDASWTVSRITNGSIMRVPFYRSVQLVPLADIGGAGLENGVPWDNDQPWDNGQNWKFEPRAPVVEIAKRGSTHIKVDMAEFGSVLQVGHVFGLRADQYRFSHKVMNVQYNSASIATLEISPPLRRNLGSSADIWFQPEMLVKCSNAREVMSNYSSGRHTQLSTARFVEALV